MAESSCPGARSRAALHRKPLRAPLLAVALALLVVTGPASTCDAFAPGTGPGGPILVVTAPSSVFGRYCAEVLVSEGINAFAVADIGTLSAASLADHDVVILADMALTPAQVTMFTNWVDGGGNLIAMRPDPQLASLLGLAPQAGTLSDAYLLIDTSTGAGGGLVSETIQFHGTADLYTLSGATPLATLYSDATTATANPAVTLRAVGANGGQAAAFTYDLARSVVYTRQGNPAWVGQERDGALPIRPNDLYFGDAAFDPQPDWVDLDKVEIPQADEQQRLLANLILEMNLDRKPLPRFWYFPRGGKAVVIMTGDEHSCCIGTEGRFNRHVSQSPPGCSVADWECVRSTSYIYPGSGLSDTDAQAWHALGFELGVHVNTVCSDWSPASLEGYFTSQLATFTAQFPSLPQPGTERTHCIAWSDWATHAHVMFDHGVRFDTNYYYGTADWVQDRPGMFTGSGMPMRFADLDGTIIDVYQAATQMADDSGQSYPFTIDSLLDKALGAQGYYGAFTANMHTDGPLSPASDAIVASAQARGVPIISSRQMLEWLDARNDSRFDSLAWNINKLSFTITQGAGANGLRALLPTAAPRGVLGAITRNGAPVSFTVETLKGVEYGVFDAQAGGYVATYLVAGDGDGDGFAPPEDCDDGDATIFPGAVELCNGIDDDCSGQVDETFVDLATACGVGRGECSATGEIVCTPDGLGTTCGAAQGTPEPELCDGLDNDCDGQSDEDYPDLGSACSLGVGECKASGQVACALDGSAAICDATVGTPAPEICDALDNDCDGTADEDTSGAPCDTGQLGACAPGVEQCQSGVLSCVPDATPVPETCNAVDDDCDGQTDEDNPDGGAQCGVSDVGECSFGSLVCQSGALVCTGNIGPQPESCDGLDNDCNDAIDDTDPGGGLGCATGSPGVCDAGTTACQGGEIVCIPDQQSSPELCDGLDNDCDGTADEDTSGAPCDTGQLGACAPGVEQCQSGVLSCVPDSTPVPETCNAVDDDCDGQTDEDNPDGGAQCGISDVGVCSFGNLVCQSGALVCAGNVDPQPESCDGLDNDCNAAIDDTDPGGGLRCTTGSPGVCDAGTTACQDGEIVCIQDQHSSTEVCDGLDNDCDGQVDDDADGNPCATGASGACAAGTDRCEDGTLVCLPNVPAMPETCNAIDDDCDDSVDEDDPGGGDPCSTGRAGICSVGVTQCQDGSLTCASVAEAQAERCNGEDDDCDGDADEDNPESGNACATGEPGICGTGTTFCQSGTLVCSADAEPSPELCSSGRDEDCDGMVDELDDCSPCAAEDTIAVEEQTKRTTIKFSRLPSNDRISLKGILTSQQPGSISLDTQELVVRLSDETGLFYEGRVPAGEFVERGGGRKFIYRDTITPPVHDGIGKGNVVLKKDLMTAKYVIRASSLDLPEFSGSTATLTLRLGTTCYTDTVDRCTVTSTGGAVKCR